MLIYDSSKKEKLAFEPLDDMKVKIYVCGPTVYDDAHLGHARSAIVFDLLRRTLEELGYQVTFVKNFTDIDDKIIKKIKETQKPLEAITQYYIDRYLEDMQALGVRRADIEPRATQTLERMFELIETLLSKGCAYKTAKGDIYFDVSKDPDYRSLSGRCDEEAQSRIEADEEKKNPEDFALWKACKPKEEVCFESPFGKGRPGWHIECSAMIDKFLADKSEYAIDIHGGGSDLLFPHHENEAAQTRCARSQKLAKYWMHNGFVTISGEKMSKSLGNSFFIKDALKVYDGEILRFYLLLTHYRQNLNFNEEDLLTAKKRLDKLYRLKKRIFAVSASNEDPHFRTSLLEALGDDLNISKALAVIDEMIAMANDHLDGHPKDKAYAQKIAANLKLVERVLGIGTKNPFEYFQMGVGKELKARIEQLLKERSEAKKNRDFARADAIRNEILSMGITIMDTPAGTFWEKL